MIKEAGFLWSAAIGNLLFCFLPSLLLCFSVSLPAVSFGFSCRVSISSQRDFSGISAGFSIIHKSVDKCTENPFNNFLITCGISTFPYLHPWDYGYPQGY